MSTRISESIYKWLIFVQFRLFPPVCVLCRQPGQQRTDLCRACQWSLPRIQHPCHCYALPLPPGEYAQTRCGRCLVHPPFYARMIAALDYKPPVTALVAGFKYNDRLVNGRVLASSLGELLQSAYTQEQLPGLLLPVPLHARRLRQRGYNQSLQLARCLSRDTGIPVAPELVIRTRDTPHQTGLGAAQRRKNLRGAFQLNPAVKIPSSTPVAIVDDVVTTGTTVNEMARVLLKGGACEVHVWALARTVV